MQDKIVLMKAAKMQREIKTYKEDIKRYVNMLHERDDKIKEKEEEIKKLKDEIVFKDKMISTINKKKKGKK